MKPVGSCSLTICLKAQIFIWTGPFDFSPWLHPKNGTDFVVLLILAFNWLQISAIGKTVLGYCLLRTLRFLAILWKSVEIWNENRFSFLTYLEIKKNDGAGFQLDGRLKSGYYFKEKEKSTCKGKFSAKIDQFCVITFQLSYSCVIFSC